MMNVVLLIIAECLKIMQSQMGGSSPALDVGQAFVSIISKAKFAYEQQVGKPLDPGLIKPYEPL